MHIGLHVKYPLFLSDFTESIIFERFSNIKFHGKPYRGSELLHADGRTDVETDMSKLIVAFRNFANALNKLCCLAQHCRADNTVMLQYLSVKNHAVGYSVDVFCTPSVSQYIK